MSQPLTDTEEEKQQPPHRISDTKVLPIAMKTTTKLLNVLSQITIEPIMFVSAIAKSMTSTITQNLIQKRICEQFFQGSKENCTDYMTAFNGTSIADDIQRVASDYTLYENYITTLPSILLVILIAPWSDRHGRKFIIMLPLFGGALTSICNAVVAKIETATPQDILLSMIILGISGHHTLLSMSCFSYFSEMTAESDRTARVAIMSGLSTVGTALGGFIGGYTFAYSGYVPVYLMSATLELIVLLYVAFRIKNVRPDKLTTNSGHERLTESEDTTTRTSSENSATNYLDGLMDNVRVCFKQRSGYLRALIFLLLLCDILHSFSSSEMQLLFLYTRKMYNWNVQKYTNYTTFNIVINSIGMFVFMPILSKVLGIRDSILGLFSICVMFIAHIIKIFSYYTPLFLWIASSFGVIAVFSFVVDRAMLSKCVEANELGKLLAVNSFITTVSGLPAKAVYTQVYKISLDKFTGTIFILSAALTLPTLVIYCFIFYTTKKQSNVNSSNTM